MSPGIDPPIPQLALGLPGGSGHGPREYDSFPGEIVVLGIFRADEGGGRRIGAVTDNLHALPTASGHDPDCSAGPTSIAIFVHVW